MEMLLVLSFLLGLTVGSFLNVVIIRGQRSEKITGRSYCESCGKTLSFYELLPILSFVLQKGRCRSCGAALSWQYPLVELGTGVLFALTTWYFISLDNILLFERSRELTYLFRVISHWSLVIVALSSSIVIFVSDLRWKIIPNGAVLTLFLSGVAMRLLNPSGGVVLPPEASLATGGSFSEGSLWWDFGAAITISLFFAGIWFITKGRGMGLGDAKLSLGTSLIVGFPASIAAAIISFWLGALVGIALVLTRYKSLKDQIPFGPFILIGTALAYFFAEDFISLLY